MKRIAIFGPPGTGKTTKLMSIIEQELESGVDPNKIAFVSFTNAAVDEAKKRVSKKFGFRKGDMHWFRTIHSLCFMLTRLPGQRVVNKQSLAAFAQLHKVVNFSNSSKRKQRGDLALEAYHLSRCSGKSLKEAWMCCTNWMVEDFNVIDGFIDAYERWKEKEGLIDFQDMIENYLKHPITPDIDVSIVDEAQDLNMVQWDVVEQTFAKSERQYIAGDDDQAIYAWSGSRVDKMIDYPADEKIMLKQSYRCPSSVHAVAGIILGRIKTRQEKSWNPTKNKGMYKAVGDISFVPFDKYRDESWFVLVRSTHILEDVKLWLKSIGIMYRDEQGAYSINQKTAAKIMTIKRLQDGEAVKVSAARRAIWDSLLGYNVLDLVHLPTQGEVTIQDLKIKTLWKADPVSLFEHRIGSNEEIEYYRTALHINEDLMKPVQFELLSIHKSKGREADNVVVMLDQTGTILDAMMLDPDNEHRNWYVAVTRAKRRLFTVVGHSIHNYSL